MSRRSNPLQKARGIPCIATSVCQPFSNQHAISIFKFQVIPGDQSLAYGIVKVRTRIDAGHIDLHHFLGGVDEAARPQHGSYGSHALW